MSQSGFLKASKRPSANHKDFKGWIKETFESATEISKRGFLKASEKATSDHPQRPEILGSKKLLRGLSWLIRKILKGGFSKATFFSKAYSREFLRKLEDSPRPGR